MNEARKKGAKLITLCNYPGTQSSRLADGTLEIRAGVEIGVAATKTFLCSLTTLYMLVTGEIPPYYTDLEIETDIRNLFINLEDGDFQYYQPVRMRDDPTWVNVTECFKDTGQVAFDVAKKMHSDQAEELFSAAQRYTENLQRLKDILSIDLPEQVIPPEASLDEAIDVFDRVNSLGTKLTDAELALTHVTGKWPLAITAYNHMIVHG